MPSPTIQLLQNGPIETAPLGISHECANAERMATLLITHRLAFRKRSILAIRSRMLDATKSPMSPYWLTRAKTWYGLELLD